MTDRRSVVQGSGLLGVLLGSQLASPSLAGQAELEGISQPAAPAAKSFMERAFEMRRLAVEKRDCGYGAVIVRNNVIVGQSWSRVILDHDPTAHAEVAAIRDAARRLQERNLNGMVMYSSSRPCPMCEAAAYWAGIERMVHGRDLNDAGSPRLCG